MAPETVRIGIIGTGFGQSAMVPGFRLAEGATVVAICSSRRERAEAAARVHGIPRAYTDYRAMLAESQLDLVCIATPTATHAPITLAALEAGCHVLCEKPMARDVAEAIAMLTAARRAGVIHLIDHELRFNPTRARAARLIANGYVGRVYYASIRNVSGIRADPQQPWSWWSDRAQGGGALGASGSHQIDLLRWWLGEFEEVSGQLETYVRQRPDPATGTLRPVDSDDHFSFSARLTGGIGAHVFVSYVARHGGSSQVEVHGDAGSLVLDHNDRLWGRRVGMDTAEELTLPDPLEGAPGLSQSVWARSFAHLAAELVVAIREGRQPQRGANFEDGLWCQAVLDAVRRSSEERRWVEVEKGAEP
ncbi:MAG: Gfo/Idh/MocA family oxidoreductase [Chloroflexi bacterium OHK40]